MTSQTAVTVTRRRFLGQGSAAVLAAAWLGRRTGAVAAGETSLKDKPLLRLGAPLEDPPQDPEALALAHRKLGYRAAYAPRSLWELGEDYTRAVRAAFEKHDVVFGYTGGMMAGNFLHPDPATRAKNMKSIKSQLELADRLGARCCCVLPSTFSPVENSWKEDHPDNLTPRFLKEYAKVLREFLAEAAPKTAKLAIHRMPWFMDPDDYVRLFDAVDHEALAGFLHFGGTIEEQEWLEEWFEKIGDKTVCCHSLLHGIKSMYAGEPPAPQEALDKVNTTFLRGVAALPGEVPVLMEHLEPDEYLLLRDYYYKLRERGGIRFN